jgi:heme/copper-type cytochrome/quinol oxidase subunit 2
MSGKQRVILIVLAIAAAVVAIVVLPSLGDDDADKSTAVATITVRDAKPVGGIKRLTFKKGETVKFNVTSDVADEIHVHGYDLKKDVPAGGQVTMSFKAKADGIYEVELENLAQQIAELRVNP